MGGMRDGVKKAESSGFGGIRISEKKYDGVHNGTLIEVKEIAAHTGDATILEFQIEGSSNAEVNKMVQDGKDSGVEMQPIGLYYKADANGSSLRNLMAIICNLVGMEDKEVQENPQLVDAFFDGAFNGMPIKVTSATNPQKGDPSKNFTKYKVERQDGEDGKPQVAPEIEGIITYHNELLTEKDKK